MPAWPLPDFQGLRIPRNGEPGSFWENRGDRRHCGVDLYAPPGSRVAAIVAGRVIRTGVQTSPGAIAYWNRTCYVLVRGDDGTIIRYAELGGISVSEGDMVGEGQCIGTVGAVLDLSRIGAEAPAYIRRLGAAGASSMLHLEVYAALPEAAGRYLGGNWFGTEQPPFLVDPTEMLRNAGEKP